MPMPGKGDVLTTSTSLRLSVASTGFCDHALNDEVDKAVIKGLGGGSNIKSSEPCITRIRCDLVDPSKVDKAALAAQIDTTEQR